ncbi:hypothetical protein GCM10009859_24580 [Kocuria salsicia]
MVGSAAALGAVACSMLADDAEAPVCTALAWAVLVWAAPFWRVPRWAVVLGAVPAVAGLISAGPIRTGTRAVAALRTRAAAGTAR